MKLFAALALSASLIVTTTDIVAGPAPLPKLGASPDGVSVSGLSSGAFMAVQYQVAYSSSVVGAGIVAGGPYYCADNNMYFTPICMGLTFVAPDASLMVKAARGFAEQNKIDPLSNLQKSRIYVFSGTKDSIVKSSAVNATVAFFRQAGVPDSNLVYVNDVPAGHALLTPRFGNACAENATPYISHCIVNKKGYDQVGAMFTQIYGTMAPPATKLTGHILSFDQREFVTPNSSMADEGFVYVPARCAAGVSCRVHVAFHGCKQSAQSVKDDFYGKTSYNAWADTNDLIVLFPQVNTSYIPSNTEGCWDWWGYSGDDYAFKSGPQMKAIHDMVERLTQSIAAMASK